MRRMLAHTLPTYSSEDSYMSRSTRMFSVALASLPLIAFTAAIEAANTSSTATAPDAQTQGDAKMQGDAHHWRHHDMHGHGPGGEAGGLMSVLRGLDLTSAQKDQVH